MCIFSDPIMITYNFPHLYMSCPRGCPMKSSILMVYFPLFSSAIVPCLMTVCQFMQWDRCFFLQKSPAWRWKFQYPKIANVCFVEDPENLAKDPNTAKDSQIWWSFDVLKIANVKIIKFGPGTPNLTWSRNPNLWLTKPQIWQLVF